MATVGCFTRRRLKTAGVIVARSHSVIATTFAERRCPSMAESSPKSCPPRWWPTQSRVRTSRSSRCVPSRRRRNRRRDCRCRGRESAHRRRNAPICSGSPTTRSLPAEGSRIVGCRGAFSQKASASRFINCGRNALYPTGIAQICAVLARDGAHRMAKSRFRLGGRARPVVTPPTRPFPMPSAGRHCDPQGKRVRCFYILW